jgi:hypothetical protein
MLFRKVVIPERECTWQTMHKVSKSKHDKTFLHQRLRLYPISKMMLVTKTRAVAWKKTIENEETEILISVIIV